MGDALTVTASLSSADLNLEVILFDSPGCVRLTGKERICPPWPETVLWLKKLLAALNYSVGAAAVPRGVV